MYSKVMYFNTSGIFLSINPTPSWWSVMIMFVAFLRMSWASVRYLSSMIMSVAFHSHFMVFMRFLSFMIMFAAFPYHFIAIRDVSVTACEAGENGSLVTRWAKMACAVKTVVKK